MPPLPPLGDLPRQVPPPTDEELMVSVGQVVDPTLRTFLGVLVVELLLVILLLLVKL